MTDIALSYLLIFTPLVTAISCQLFVNQKIIKTLSFTQFLIISIIATILFYKTIPGHKITSKAGFSPSIALEFSINNIGAIFLIALIVLKFSILLFFYDKISKNLKKKNFSLFFSTISINIFAICGILTTSNLLNLFIFIEIYAISFFAIFLIKNDKRTAQILLNQFLLNAAASAALLFCVLIIYFNLKTFDLDIIRQKILLAKNASLLKVMSVPIFVSISVKFFSFLFHQASLKNNNLFTSHFAAKSLFLSTNLGIFVIFRLNFLFFKEISTLLIIASLLILAICYSASKIFLNRHLKIIINNFCLLNITLMILCLLFKTHYSHQAIISYWFSFNLLGFFLYIFANLLILQSEGSSFDKIPLLFLGDSRGIAISRNLLRIILPFIFALPFTFIFQGNYNLALSILEFSASTEAIAANLLSLFIILPALAQLALLICALRIALNLFYPDIDPEEYDVEDEPESKFAKYPLLLLIMTILIYLLALNPKILSLIAQNFVFLLK